MAGEFNITVNDKALQISLKNFSARITPEPLLKIAGEVMRGSIERTFREQGSPAGSWAPLAASTLKRGKGGAGRLKLIQSARLKNSLTPEQGGQKIVGNSLIIGTNLVYARIQQEGGFAGRREPSNRRKLGHHIDQQIGGFHGPMNFRRPFIPARPYLVFRPEDPQRMTDAMERYIDAAASEGGLK